MVRQTGHLDNKFKCMHLEVLVSRFCLQAFKVEVWVYRMNAKPTAPVFSCWVLAMRHAYLMQLAGCCGINKLVSLHVLDVLSLNTN